jgi:KipI family sensor histidine kinase inhibitor
MEPSTSNEPFCRILPLGDAAFTVEFGRCIDPAVNDRVLTFADGIRAQGWPEVLDVVPSFSSVTIHIDPLLADVTALSDRALALSRTGFMEGNRSGRAHTIPVLYGGESGPDLNDVAVFANLSIEDTIRSHSSVCYRVYMLGFSPGFPYLGAVPATIAMPRLSTPRTRVPAGSVGIAENQTGIYPTATPGGWRLIGRTPVSLYRPHAAVPFLIHAGDTVRFQPIGPEEFARLSRTSNADAA